VRLLGIFIASANWGKIQTGTGQGRLVELLHRLEFTQEIVLVGHAENQAVMAAFLMGLVPAFGNLAIRQIKSQV
jgi:hypothetical protein